MYATNLHFKLSFNIYSLKLETQCGVRLLGDVSIS